MRWGISCEVKNEAQLGIILAVLRIHDATFIGFDPINEKAGKEVRRLTRDLAAIGPRNKPKKAKGPRRNAKPGENLAKLSTALDSIPSGTQIRTSQLCMNAGVRDTGAAAGIVRDFVKKGFLKRAAFGIYERTAKELPKQQEV